LITGVVLLLLDIVGWVSDVNTVNSLFEGKLPSGNTVSDSAQFGIWIILMAMSLILIGFGWRDRNK
jgi:hypothetical protein